MKKSGLRYIVYVRKSEERAERQDKSISAQKAEVKRAFPDVKVILWLEESQSAFKMGRPLFAKAMDMIERGEADGIIAWHPNRLSRNEIDAARVTYALRGPLKDLKFVSYNFDNSPAGIMMLQILMSQGQYESASKAVDVRRGMREKAKDGERPGRVWPGYTKVPVLGKDGKPLIKGKDKKVVTETAKDPARYELINQAWQWFLYDRLNPAEIRRKLNALGYRTPTFNRYGDNGEVIGTGGGVPMPANGVRKILTSPFYYGYIEHEGELHKGSHHAIRMITEEEYDLAQHLLGKKGRPRQRTHDHAYNGLIRCGECDCMVTETVKEKLVKATNRLEVYRYYGCTKSLNKQTGKKICTQENVTTSELEEQISEELGKYELLPEFTDIALTVLRRQNKMQTSNIAGNRRKLEQERADIQSQLDELTGMRSRKLLDDDEYLSEKQRLKAQRVALDRKLNNATQQADQWLNAVERGFSFATTAPDRFKHGSLAVKRDILRTLGETLIMQDKKLFIEVATWLVPIAEHAPELQKAYLYIRTKQKANPKELELALDKIFASWRAIWDSNPGHAA